MRIPSPVRVASRFMTAAVKVEVIDKATEKARQRFGQGIAIGRFKSPIKLYRVFDGEELREILDTGEIKGGDYSVKGERAFGAQWGGDKVEVAKWGERQRGKRLGHELFLAEIDGNGRVFSHLSGADGKMNPGVGIIDLDPTFCSTGLGCSIPIQSNSVKGWYSVENGTPTKVSLNDLKSMSAGVGLKPRDHDVYKGVRLSGLPKKLQKALQWELLQADPEFRQARYDDDWPTQRTKMQEAGVGPRDSMDGEKLGQLLIRAMCKEVGPEDCSDWGTSHSKAEQDAGKADNKNSFSILAALVAHDAATFRRIHVSDAKVKYVEVRTPQGRWHRIWQPWGADPIWIGDNGSVGFR